MSLFIEDIHEVTHKEPEPLINNANKKSHVENNVYVSRKALITHVQGHSWTIPSYYSQVIGSQDELRGLTEGASPLHQQYREIRNLELKVNSTLTPSQEGESKIFNADGEAMVYGVFIPNAGDVFIASIGDGRTGLFTVTSSEKLNFFKDSIYKINYQLTDYLTETKANDLKSKTVKIYHFRREYLDYGSSPLIEDEHIEFVRSLEKSYYYLLEQYFTDYFSLEYGTILIPGQTKPTYDPYLVESVLDLFFTVELPNFNKIRRLNVKEDIAYKVPTLFKALEKRELFILNQSITQVGLTNSKEFSINADFNSVRFSGIDLVVYPKDIPIHIDVHLDYRKKSITKSSFDEKEFLLNTNTKDRELTTVKYPNITGYEENTDTGELTPIVQESSVNLIYPINIDDYYIFSSNFYNNTDTQSLLELQVRDYISGNATDTKVLYQLSEDWKYWNTLERFYYTPIILYLIHANLKGL